MDEVEEFVSLQMVGVVCAFLLRRGEIIRRAFLCGIDIEVVQFADKAPALFLMLCMPFLRLAFIQSGENAGLLRLHAEKQTLFLALYEGRKEGICLLHMQSLRGEVGKPAFQCVNFVWLCGEQLSFAFRHRMSSF